jgi:hypothetical protein
MLGDPCGFVTEPHRKGAGASHAAYRTATVREPVLFARYTEYVWQP